MTLERIIHFPATACNLRHAFAHVPSLGTARENSGYGFCKMPYLVRCKPKASNFGNSDTKTLPCPEWQVYTVHMNTSILQI